MAVKCLTTDQKKSIWQSKATNASLARKYGVSPDTIRRVKLEKSKKVSRPARATPDKPEYVWNASSKFISISRGRDTWNTDFEHPRFKEALQFLFDGDVESALKIINTKMAVTSYVDGEVRIEDDSLFYKDIELKTGLTDRIINSMNNGKEFKTLIPFLKNLMLNPSRKAVYRLFDFLEANDIEITDDGHFIAFKKVRKDFKDIYTGTLDNSPGQVLSVDRNTVDEDDNRTCSHGLHVCSKSYLNCYGSYTKNKVVKVKVHPKDVVSIPVDYNNAKMRTCGYTVLEEL